MTVLEVPRVSGGEEEHGHLEEFRTDQAVATAARLRQYRDDAGRTDHDFIVLAPLTDLLRPEDLERAEAGGVTHILTQPWAYYCPPDAPISAKIDAMGRFWADFKLDNP